MISARTSALCLAVVLAGCSSRPDPALHLTETALGSAGTVSMLVATTRRPVDNPGLRFGGERSISARFAEMTISIPPNHKTGEISWPSSAPSDPATTFAATRFAEVPRERLKQSIQAATRNGKKRHVLVFVHGYNTRFDESAFRLAQIVYDSRADVLPVLFSWPSWGTLSAYPYDRESAAVSRDGLEMMLTELAQEPSVSQVSVLAHSMGGWLTLEAFRQMAIRQKQIPAKITDVMLAAPDVDVDVALSQGQALRDIPSRPRITLFVSSQDRALNASRLLWGSRDRLGNLNPNEEPYKTNLAKGSITVVDLTAAAGGDQLNHTTFAQSPAVVRLIGARLASGQQLEGATSLTERAGALTQGTVRVVGDVISAPARLASPQPPGGQPQ
jgi:esterase/lipase superfamily enzyme